MAFDLAVSLQQSESAEVTKDLDLWLQISLKFDGDSEIHQEKAIGHPEGSKFMVKKLELTLPNCFKGAGTCWDLRGILRSG